MEADSALTNQQGFNRQLAGAILCYVEETNLNNTGSRAYERIKNWVTGDNISIHPKGVDPYMMPNTTHWVQCANSREACPVFSGDSRIMVIEVSPLTCEEIPWKYCMKPALEKESPDFLRTLLDTPLPEPVGRLWLPVLETAAKREATQNKDQGKAKSSIDENKLVEAVKMFISEKMHYEMDGQKIPIERRSFWEGTFSALVDDLGYDDTAPNQLSHALRAVQNRLSKNGIEIIFPEDQRTADTRKVTIGECWLVEPKCSPEEEAADAERCAQLEDEIPIPGMAPSGNHHRS